MKMGTKNKKMLHVCCTILSFQNRQGCYYIIINFKGLQLMSVSCSCVPSLKGRQETSNEIETGARRRGNIFSIWVLLLAFYAGTFGSVLPEWLEELQMHLREDFTTTEKAPTKPFSLVNVPTSAIKLVGAFSMIVKFSWTFVWSSSG